MNEGLTAKFWNLPADVAPVPSIAYDQLPTMAYTPQAFPSSSLFADFNGDKFVGGFGETKLFTLDYWSLRERSAQLFTENLYARGLIRRLITNEINSGLTPELCPEETILGRNLGDLNPWTEDTENRFGIWAANPELCDYYGQSTFGAIQRAARMEALISGDVLVVLRVSQRTGLPSVQLIKGSSIRTPFGGDERVRSGNSVFEGVETDARGRIVAYWIEQKDGEHKRMPAFGEKSGRRMAWLLYGTEKRLGNLRGEPLLSIILQSLKEVDRYRDSSQRKAVINSLLAMFIKKTENRPGTLPATGAAVRRDTVTTRDSDGTTRQFKLQGQIPGLVMEELQVGEEPVGFRSQGTEETFGTFEAAILQAIAWANEIPPEILQLAFSNNYSASQAAINEFKIYLNKIWSEFGEDFCTPIAIEWLISEVLAQKISAPGLLQAWRDPSQYDIYGAWISMQWFGSIKPSTDMLKQARGSELLVQNGWATNGQQARALTGTKFSKNIEKLKHENRLKAEAARPLLELEREFGQQQATQTLTAIEKAAYIGTENALHDAQEA